MCQRQKRGAVVASKLQTLESEGMTEPAKRERLIPGDWLLGLIVLLPVLPVLVDALDQMDGSWSGTTSALMQLTGILALSTFIAAGVLTARIPRLDRWFGGLVRIWHIHRALGFSAFLLMMAHVLLVALAALPVSATRSIEALFPPLSAWPIWAGWASLLLLALFMLPGFGPLSRLSYQSWKRLHALCGVALVLALAHAVVLSATPWLWGMLGALAVAAVVWRRLLSPFIARNGYWVEGVDQLARDVYELRLRPELNEIEWHPGQFVYLTPMEPELKAGYREEHPFTIASHDREGVMRIGIKALGDATEALQRIPRGGLVHIEGPYGRFLEPLEPARRRLWIGGGIGITPFVAGVRALRDGAMSAPETTLFYLANRPERAYYRNELLQAAVDTKGLRVMEHYMNEDGVITEAFLTHHCPDFADREVWLCGPPGMVRHVKRLLKSCGVPGRLIHTEAFDFS